MSSREAMADRSIIIVASGDRYLILNECGANLMEKSESRYLIAYGRVSVNPSFDKRGMTYCGESTGSVEIAFNGNFDGFDITSKCKGL